MNRYYSALLCMSLYLFIAPFVYSADWLFPFPVTYLDVTVGEVDAFSDGKSVSKVHTAQLHTLIAPALTTEISNRFTSYKDVFVPVETLKEWGCYSPSHRLIWKSRYLLFKMREKNRL